MKTKLLMTLLAGFILTFSSPVYAYYGDESADDVIEDGSMILEFRNFNPSLTFKAKTSSDTSTTDFKNSLGLEDKRSNEIRLNLGRTLRLSYTKFSYSGIGTPSVTVNYDGQSFDGTATTTTNLDIDYARLSWMIPVTTSDEMTTKWIFDIKAFKVATEISGKEQTTGTALAVNKKFVGGLPTVGFSTAFRVASDLTAYAEVTGLPLGKYGHFYDMEGGLKYDVGNFSVGAGYRNFDLNINYDSNAVQLKLAGPYYNLMYKF
ncbi:MAG: hypothetical protein H6Q74_2571 [Firmicutes bacterium]|nr:hypothetical protein [Bacillota bacterium]